MSLTCYLHLGVHKTATSSLQKNILEALPPSYDYLGVRYPRATRQRPLYTELMHAVCRADEAEFERTLDSLQQRLKDAAAGHERGIVISDELFSTGGEEFFGGQIGVQARLQRLGRLLKDFDTRVLLTVRHQPDAIYSLYVQKYNYLPARYQRFETFYRVSDLRAYDYAGYGELIAETLKTERLFLADFHDIGSGRYLAAVAAWLEREEVAEQSLSEEKKRAKDAAGVEVDRVSLAYRLKRLLPTSMAQSLARSAIGQRLLKPLYRHLERIKTSRATTLPSLSAEMKQRIHRDFKDSNARLRERHQIHWPT